MSQQPKVLSENIILYTSPFFENTAKVVLPSTAAPKGKIVLNLGSPRPDAGLVSRDLLDAADNFAVSATATKFAYPLDPATQTSATDNQIIRLQDGSLLASKNGYTWSDLSPKPEWFDTGSFQYGSSLSSPRARNAVYLFRSTDAGQSWTLWSLIDAAVAADGKYGWPQPNKGPTGFGIGGFDRTELYQDPWSGDIYVSGHGDGGPYTLGSKTTSNHAGLIFRSQDNGKSWGTFQVLDGSAPYVMTSTPDHGLIVFHIRNNVPTFYYEENGTMSAAKDVTASDGTNPLAWGEDTEVDDVLRGLHPCLSRIGKYGSQDRAWIAYPTLNPSGRQTYVVATVAFGGTADPTVTLIENVTAEDPTTTSAAMGAFVYDDLVDPDDQNTHPSCTVFYWVDTPPKTSTDKNKLLARYQVFHSGTSFPPGYLSVSGGNKRYFARVGIGDYFSGGYFWLGNKLNFLAQWNEQDGIKANIVSLEPFPKISLFDEIKEFFVEPDPLALLLNEVLARLTLPDPPPPDILRQQIKALLKGLSIAQRRAALANLNRLQSYLNAASREFKDPARTSVAT
jgi:hypothetical protein